MNLYTVVVRKISLFYDQLRASKLNYKERKKELPLLFVKITYCTCLGIVHRRVDNVNIGVSVSE